MEIRKDNVVLEVRPPLTRSIWPWIGEQLGDFELVDGSTVKREKDNDHFAKIVLRGNQNSVRSLWKNKTKTMVYQGNMISLRCVGYGAFNATQFGPSHFEQGAEEVEFEFDSHEDANAVINNKDMNRALDASESSIIDIIDEVGSHLPQLHREFETHSKSAALMGSDAKYISVHGAAKAMEGVLHIHVKVENLLLEDFKLIDLTMHSAAHLLGDDEDKYNVPFLTYVQFLTIYLKLKRLKEEDPNIVSPRLNSPRAAEPPPPGQGTALGGGGDTFGRGLAALVSPRTSPRTLGLSPRSEASLSPRVPSPRTLPSLTIFRSTEDTSKKEFTSPRLAGTGGDTSPGASPERGVGTNSVSARMALSTRAENIVNKRDTDKLKASLKKEMLSIRRKRYDPKQAMMIRRRCDVFDAKHKFKRDFGDLTVIRPTPTLSTVNTGATKGGVSDGVTFSSACNTNKLKPIVPRLPLGGNSNRGSESRMDRFIDRQYGNSNSDRHDDNSISDKTAIALVGSPGLDQRMIRKRAFPALRSDRVEPQHWFVTLQFWENIYLQYSSCVPSDHNKGESKGSNTVSAKKDKRIKEKTLQDVYRNFKSFDPTAFYAADDYDDDGNNDDNDSVKIFLSDVPALMDSLGFRSKVHISNDLNLEADTIHTNIDTHTHKDGESGVRLGTGDTYWCCELVFWASLFSDYRIQVKTEVERRRKEERRRKREEAFLLGIKLKKEEIKREETREEKISGLGISEDVKDMESLAQYYEENKDAPLVTEPVPESTPAKKGKRGNFDLRAPIEQQPKINLADLDIASFLRLQDTHYVHWSEFKSFFLHILTSIVSTQLIALRRLIASEMWLNIKQKAVHLDLAKILADPTEYKRERFERQQAAKDRERERTRLMAGELFVGGETQGEDKRGKEDGKSSDMETKDNDDKGSFEGKEAKMEHQSEGSLSDANEAAAESKGSPDRGSTDQPTDPSTDAVVKEEEEEEVEGLMEQDKEKEKELGELEEEVADAPEDNDDKPSLLEKEEVEKEEEADVQKPLSARERFELSQRRKAQQKTGASPPSKELARSVSSSPGKSPAKEKEKGVDEEKPLSARERFKLSQQQKQASVPNTTAPTPEKEKGVDEEKSLSARERFKLSQQQKQASATDTATTTPRTVPTLEKISTTQPASSEKEKEKTVSSPMRQRFKAAQMAKKQQDPGKDVVISPRMDTTQSGLRDESKVNSSPVHPSNASLVHSPRSGEKEKGDEVSF